MDIGLWRGWMNPSVGPDGCALTREQHGLISAGFTWEMSRAALCLAF